jgi:protein-tyrosine phosphatase
VSIEVVSAGEVALTLALQLDDATLDGLCLGEGRWLLVESPYGHATDMLADMVFDIQRRGYDVLLAHPERSPTFVSDRERLATLVERGVAASVTAASLSGGFGRRVKAVTVAMIEEGLVHNIASDAHDTAGRPPALSGAVRAIEAEVRGLEGQGSWFVEDAPRAFLAGGNRPTPPEARRRRRGPWRGRRSR